MSLLILLKNGHDSQLCDHNSQLPSITRSAEIEFLSVRERRTKTSFTICSFPTAAETKSIVQTDFQHHFLSILCYNNLLLQYHFRVCIPTGINIAAGRHQPSLTPFPLTSLCISTSAWMARTATTTFVYFPPQLCCAIQSLLTTGITTTAGQHQGPIPDFLLIVRLRHLA